MKTARKTIVSTHERTLPHLTPSERYRRVLATAEQRITNEFHRRPMGKRDIQRTWRLVERIISELVNWETEHGSARH